MNCSRTAPLLVFALAAAAFLGAPRPAEARPVTRILDLVVGSEQFFRIGAEVRAVVDAPEIVTAEVLGSNELLLTPKAAGRALIYLMTPGTFDAVRIRVRESGGKLPEVRASEEQLKVARKACQSFSVESSPEGGTLSANMPNGTCRGALLALFDSDDFLADRVSLMYSEEVIREQYEEIQSQAKAAGLVPGFELAYLGPTLRIKGRGDAAGKLELMKIAYRATPGRLLLDDQSEVVAPPATEVANPDAGEPADASK